MLLCLFLMFPLAEVGPKKILDLMNVPGLTRENVASHLQVVDVFYSLGFQGIISLGTLKVK